eukprot:jgi/Psemu1/301182/fgenesh1_kg.27_\
MYRQTTIISQCLLVLLLCIDRGAAYLSPTKRIFNDFKTSGTAPSLRQPSECRIRTEHAFHCGRRRNRCNDTNDKRIDIGVGLASRSSSDDQEREDFEHPANADGVLEVKKPLLSSPEKNNDGESEDAPSIVRRMFDEIPFVHLFYTEGRKKLPPVQIEDFGVMLYDVFLIVNLSLSISFWVTHRMDFTFIPYAFNEGCLFSILWIASGLYHGSFLYSAMDGHFPLDDEKGRGGPQAAAALAFNTYINAVNLRLVSALIGAWLEHRKVGEGSLMEELIPLEIGCGIVLMTFWRALHSQVTPRFR